MNWFQKLFYGGTMRAFEERAARRREQILLLRAASEAQPAQPVSAPATGCLDARAASNQEAGQLCRCLDESGSARKDDSNIPLCFRPFARKDISPCVQLVAKHWGWDWAMTALEHFKDSYGSIRFVVEKDSKVKGVIGIFAMPEFPEGYAAIDWFVVEAQSQKQGIGTMLLNFSEAIARQNYTNLFVWCDSDAVEFYKKCGYEIATREILPREGHVMLEKKLWPETEWDAKTLIAPTLTAQRERAGRGNSY